MENVVIEQQRNSHMVEWWEFFGQQRPQSDV